MKYKAHNPMRRTSWVTQPRDVAGLALSVSSVVSAPPYANRIHKFTR